MIRSRNVQNTISLALGVLTTITLIAMPLSVSATGALTFPQSGNVELIIGGTTYALEVLSGSDADSMTVNDAETTITVGLTSGESFIIRSADGLRLTNNSGTADVCSGGQDTLTIPTTTTATVVIAPNGDKCSTGGGGGGGGGSGGYAYSYTTPTPTPTPTPSTSVTPIPSVTPTATPAVGLRANGSLIRYQGDSKVYVLDGGYKRWIQTASDFTALGYDWSKILTISLNETYPDGAVMTAAGRGQVTATFVHLLSRGSRGSEVKALQQKLKDLGFFPAGVDVTGTFGPTTIAAVKAFQKAHGIAAVGYVGPATRAALNQ